MEGVRVMQYATSTSLSLIVYDLFLTWNAEVQYIWKNSSWWIKISFFISRYIALAVQIFNVVVHLTPTILQRLHATCLLYFRIQISSFILLLTNLELVMMIRGVLHLTCFGVARVADKKSPHVYPIIWNQVYALYDQDLRMGVVLAFWFLVCRIHNCWIGVMCPRTIDADANCIFKTIESSRSWSILVIFNQFVLWVLTYRKYRHITRPGWSIPPLVWFVLRDSSWALLALTGLLFSLLPYPAYIRHVEQVIGCLFGSVLSILSCRLMLNIRSLKTSESDPQQYTLSTVQTMGELESQISQEG